MYKLPGFPVLIAFWKFILGPHWSAGIFLTNLAFLLFACVHVYRFTRDLSWPWILRLFIVLTCATGVCLGEPNVVLNRGLFNLCALVVVLGFCRFCLGKALSRGDKIAVLLCLIFMSFLREVTPWFAITMLPLVFTSWKLLKKKAHRPLAFLFVATMLPIKTLCAINAFFFDCPIASFGQADTMAWALGHLTSKNPRFINLEPNLQELFPDGGGDTQGHAWCQYAVSRGNILAEEWEENLSFRKSLRYQEYAFEKAKMRLERGMQKLFFTILLFHPVDCWEGTEASASFSLLTQHGPLYFLWKGTSFFSIYGIILCLIGFLWALRGMPSFFKKIPSSKEALVQFSLLLHIVGFLLLYTLSIGADLLSVGHVVFLSGLLGWWSIMDGIRHWRTKRRASLLSS